MSALARLALPLMALLGLWQGLVWLLAPPPFILPGPIRVLGVLWRERAMIAGHALVTLGEVLAGLVLGAALGWGSALGLALSGRLRRMLQPALVASLPAPDFPA